MHWAFGVQEPDCYGAIEVDSGRAIIFMPERDENYIIWMGKPYPPEHFERRYDVQEVHFFKEDEAKIVEVLKSKDPSVLLRLKGKNTDSGKFTKPVEFNGIKQFDLNDNILHHEMTELRVIKTDKEVDVIRHACCVAGEAHKKMMQQARPRMYELQLEGIFRGYVASRGHRHLAYTPIAGSGPNSAILHYGHAGSPNNRKMEDGDLVLCDIGSEYYCYASDITCTFPVNGKFTDEQKVIFNAVSAANLAVRQRAIVGNKWVENHQVAERTILTHLRDYGMLKGEVDDMMQVYLGGVFMPHGVGHFLGIDVHDVGGYPEGASRSDKPGLRCLRCVRTLEENMVVTIEPGCYFIDKLMDDALANPEQRKFINVEVFEKFRGFGGIRLEDVVAVGRDCAELFALLPRTPKDVEELMASDKPEQ
ncbi:xaa-Pro dipeptidase-like isoform X2 [Corticium candelabrum]|nr:xaa-Pro dipeptidase-like isoform X2 [Corticium candelabrum]